MLIQFGVMIYYLINHSVVANLKNRQILFVRYYTRRNYVLFLMFQTEWDYRSSSARIRVRGAAIGKGQVTVGASTGSKRKGSQESRHWTRTKGLSLLWSLPFSLSF